ncbi:PREDICTED: trypsin I-P38-like [Cyphomyrmex costatus]|uniref:trypsin I-P38-like n=1 Tax=Cyphomyrmex costatus TaxID=456900 RepID=UPI0008522A70|nr:PREDICTED: trypsin I-P38-like [Cyphomyrmex costatus]
MYSKAIVSFAFLAMAIADMRIGHNMPRVQLPHIRNFETRVVGGSTAPTGQYKFIVSLQFLSQHFCGGSILNERYVVTAGHCVGAVPIAGLITVKAGKFNLNTKETTEQAVRVSKAIVHSKYRGDVGPNDIALLKLASPLKLNNDVQAIALPQANSEPTGVAWLSGWGSTSTTNSPIMPSTLQHVQMQFLDYVACDKAMTKLLGSPSPVDETNICTSPAQIPLSACNVSARLVGGEDAPIGGYPFIVSLQMNSRHFCAGSILNKEWVITAAHCAQAVSSLNLLCVKAGKYNIRLNEASEQTVQVIEVYVHENYQGGVGPYDIALLKLAAPLKLTKDVQAIELAPPESEPTGKAWLCGWGSTSTSIFPRMPDKLQQVQMEYIDRTTCDEAVSSLTGSSPSPVHKTNICTGPSNKATSACSGDSGGPLISCNGQKPLLTGIVSWGIFPCGTAGAPSVYTKVSSFNNWITQKTGNY